MLAAIADEDLTAFAKAEAGLTHHDPVAGEIAATVNKLCRALIRGAGWEVALRQCVGLVEQEGPGNNGGFAPDVLQTAVYFVGTSGSFAEALERSLAFAGPANYCPVLVGAIAGARWGVSAITPSSLAHVDVLPRIRAAAEALAVGWAKADR
jgi:ADP-ribosylglycohydrolase